jgi:hypothetical protein
MCLQRLFAIANIHYIERKFSIVELMEGIETRWYQINAVFFTISANTLRGLPN